jgi:hypothetical protein
MAAIERAVVVGLLAASVSLWLAARPGHAEPSPPSPSAQRGQLERLQGFTTVVVNHVNDAMGTELLPVAEGGGVETGVLVTVTMDALQIFDQDAAALKEGRPVDPTIAAECASGCPAAFYDAFGRSWLAAAVESTAFAVEIPSRVLLAAHRELPAATLLQVAYAAAETRPVQPPQLALLVNNTRGSLRAQPFFLVPPRGLELRQGSAALGLTIEVSPGRYSVSATDPRYARDHQVTGLGPLRALARELKKRYPSKETVILVPNDGVTVRELVDVVATVQESFPRIVLSAGQELRTP